ncbi:MAG: hypothetical protein JWO38_124 [Gemmataceae bacterium]|nr:hypothetical protein [Gemmataceae bacterium]
MSTDPRVRISCPECDAALKVQPDLVGEEVACPRCSHEFVAKRAPAPRPRARAEPVEEQPRKRARDEDERDQDEDERPRRPRDRDEDERDEEDRPRRRRDREEDEEEDDREPRPGRCPSCGSRRSTKVSFTWWGGVLGPALFSMVRCDRCRAAYNRKSGKPIGALHIGLYSLVGIVIGVIILVGLGLAVNK